MDETNGKGTATDTTEFSIPPRHLMLTSAAAMAGLSIGLIRGSRNASWQFLAENAHRAPTTVQGWYFYKKTKNYKMMLEGLKQGAKDGVRLGIMMVCFVGIEDGIERVGWGRVKDIGAGLGSSVLFAMLCESMSRVR